MTAPPPPQTFACQPSTKQPYTESPPAASAALTATPCLVALLATASRRASSLPCCLRQNLFRFGSAAVMETAWQPSSARCGIIDCCRARRVNGANQVLVAGMMAFQYERCVREGKSQGSAS
ncbi:hypothetical protein EDB80DRAFT_780175 [Ilyonectria destructans]|nr:hypothetical protein EDB80DRAFT_780175 [Ilyonectria destructans]